jgi:hypothetical protein
MRHMSSIETHGTRLAFQADRTNTNRLLLQGRLVSRYTHDDVHDRNELVARQVLSATRPRARASGPWGRRP